MKRYLWFLLAALAFCCFTVLALGDEVQLKLPGAKTVYIADTLPQAVEAPDGGVFYVWKYPPEIKAVEMGNVLQILSAPKGQINVSVQWFTVDFENKKVETFAGKATLNIGDVPPGPDPGPDPPAPPEPDPAPIDADGLHVLIVFESQDKAKLPRGQFDIIYGMQMRDWLIANCTSDPQPGSGKAFWILDKDANVSALAQKWQSAFQRPRQSIPWLIVSNKGKGGYSGPLPATTEEAIKLMEKYK